MVLVRTVFGSVIVQYRLYVSTPDRTFTSYYATKREARREMAYWSRQQANTDNEYLLEYAELTDDDEWQVILTLRDF